MTNAVAQAADIRDIKPPIVIVDPWEWVAIAVVVALLLVVLALLVWWLSRRTRRPAVLPPVPAHARARRQLQESLALISQPKPFCIAVSDTVRWYLEERFDFRAPERTTEEFLRELAATDRLSAEQKSSLARFLESCDLVKFARYEPGENELRDWHGSAVRLIDETEEKTETGNEMPETEIVNPK